MEPRVAFFLWWHFRLDSGSEENLERLVALLELYFIFYSTLGVTENCICQIHYLALDGFDLNTVHKLSSKDSNSGLLGGKQECSLCAMQPTPNLALKESFL